MRNSEFGIRNETINALDFFPLSRIARDSPFRFPNSKMNLLDPKSAFGCIGGAVLFFVGGFAFLFVVLVGLLIQQLPFGQDTAWAWMNGGLAENASYVPPVGEQPIIVGSGEWCVTLARQLSPEESHLNHGRVYGYVRDANGASLANTPMRVEWDGGFIDQPTDANGKYEFILSPGQYAVRVKSGDSQRAYFRTNIKKYWGHYTYQVDFVRGKCACQSSARMYHPFSAKMHQ